VKADQKSIIIGRLLVRRDGRVTLRVAGVPLLLGQVQRMETHGGPAWFWSPAHDEDNWQLGGPTRRAALGGLVDTLAAGAR